MLKGICGRTEAPVKESAERFGYAYGTTNWKSLIADPEIQVLDNNGPNNVHAEPCIAALEPGKHTIVEKPLAMNVAEARPLMIKVRYEGRGDKLYE